MTWVSFKMAIIQALRRRQKLVQQIYNNTVRNYATADPLSLGTKLRKTITSEKADVSISVEEDTKRLASFVCGTKLFKETGQDVEIKPDSDYPDWLWTLHTGEPLHPSQMDPNTLEYWERVRELAIQEKKRLKLLYQQNRDYK